MDVSQYEISFHHAVPTPEEYVSLRERAGMTQKTVEAARSGLAGSLFSVCVRDAKGAAIGMGRVVGDGGCHFQVVDVVVAPEHQGNGLGRRVMKELGSWIATNVPATATVSLLADGTADALYAKFGFALSQSRGMILRKPFH